MVVAPHVNYAHYNKCNVSVLHVPLSFNALTDVLLCYVKLDIDVRLIKKLVILSVYETAVSTMAAAQRESYVPYDKSNVFVLRAPLTLLSGV